MPARIRFGFQQLVTLLVLFSMVFSSSRPWPVQASPGAPVALSGRVTDTQSQPIAHLVVRGQPEGGP
jgi:hypothetical protein